MLDKDRDAPFAAVVAVAPLRVEPPPGLLTGPCDRGPAAPFPIDDRQSARVPTVLRAAIRICHGLPAFPRDAALAGAIVQDVSLRGLRFLFDEQLYLGEELCIWLPSTELYGQVARCRRLGQKCYEVGVRLDAPMPAWLLKAAFRSRPTS